jgi:glutamate-ammonia-ligase adenylyltransferase
VDFRLRPSGNSGPLATHIDAFAEYQEKEAWTWEHMALTRARSIAGDAGLMEDAGELIARIVKRRRDAKKTAVDVLDMRALVEEAKGGEGAWDLKQAPGGMVDVEFIAQFLQLVQAAAHPELISTETEAVLAAATRAGLLTPGDSDTLIPALRLYQALTQLLRLSIDDRFDPKAAPAALLKHLADAADLPDFATLDRHLRDTEAAVRSAFERLIGKVPAATKLRNAQEDDGGD